MKKWLLVLGMITCMLGVSACSKQAAPGENEGTSFMTSEQAILNSQQYLDSVHQVVLQGIQLEEITEPTLVTVITNWQTALNDIGDYKGVVEESAVATLGEKEITVDLQIEGSTRNAKVQIVILDDGSLPSLTVSPIFSMGELMQKAGLNTLLGMGTVFAILILISLVISCFKFIPMWQAKRANAANKADHSNVQQAPVAAVVEKTISQIVEKEELTDDTELVAVIAAAIAASEGHTSVDGFIVRSIRRVSRA